MKSFNRRGDYSKKSDWRSERNEVSAASSTGFDPSKFAACSLLPAGAGGGWATRLNGGLRSSTSCGRCEARRVEWLPNCC
jgi:hypothetical protein